MSQTLNQTADRFVDVVTPIAEVTGAELTDAELLRQFVRDRRQEAFSSLIERHAGMVMRVCSQILYDRHEAEDAFQATFLVFAERAGAIRKANSLASWLYGVAYRTASRMLQQRQQRNAAPLDDVEESTQESWNCIAQREQYAILHYELRRLPERYRAALVLCYLEGKTRQQAANELDCSDASVKDRLARGRRLLRCRMGRRGALLSTAFATTLLTASTVEAGGLASLTRGTVDVALSGSFASDGVHTLVEQELCTGSLTGATKLGLAVSFLLTAGIGWSLVSQTGIVGIDSTTVSSPSVMISLEANPLPETVALVDSTSGSTTAIEPGKALALLDECVVSTNATDAPTEVASTHRRCGEK